MYQFLGVSTGRPSVAALATGAGRVSTWALKPARRLAEFDTIFGGVLGRLAVGAASGRTVVAVAAFWRGAVSGYDADTGGRIWERRDVREVRQLAAANAGRHITAAFARGPMQVLDVVTGETVAVARGARAIHGASDPTRAVATFDSGFALAQVNPWRVLSRLHLSGFGILDAEFAHDAILVSVAQEAGDGPSSVYRLSGSGEVGWRYVSRGAWNVPWLGRDRTSGEWLGVEHDPNRVDRPALIRWSGDGEVVSRLSLPDAADYAFVLDGARLVAAPGLIIDTETATVVDVLE
jgi:hypothetical protein